MVKEWVKDTQNEARLMDNHYVETSKALGSVKQKNKELDMKLVAEEGNGRALRLASRPPKRRAEE